MNIKTQRSIRLPKVFKAENLLGPIFSKDFVVMILLFVVFIPSSFNHDINIVSLNVIIPLLFFYSIYKSPYLFGKFRAFRLFIILFGWMLLSGIVATDTDLYLNEIKKILECIMFIFVLIRFSRSNFRYIYYFYILYIVKFIYIFYYAYQNGLFTVDVSSERFNLDDLNANVFGYFGFFALVGSFLLITYTQKLQKTFYNILFFAIFVLVITAGILAASRATLLISIVAFGLLMIIKYLYPITLRSLIPIILIALSAIFVSKYLDSTLQNSFVKGRFDTKEDSRFDLLFRAFDVGKDNLILGVGSGNFVLYNQTRQFSHNSFAELWANNGVIALILFILILAEPLKRIREYLRLGGNKKNSLYFLIIWASYCVYNFFYVFYINFFMLAFIFLIMMHLEYLKTVRVSQIKKNQLAN